VVTVVVAVKGHCPTPHVGHFVRVGACPPGARRQPRIIRCIFIGGVSAGVHQNHVSPERSHATRRRCLE